MPVSCCLLHSSADRELPKHSEAVQLVAAQMMLPGLLFGLRLSPHTVSAQVVGVGDGAEETAGVGDGAGVGVVGVGAAVVAVSEHSAPSEPKWLAQLRKSSL